MKHMAFLTWMLCYPLVEARAVFLLRRRYGNELSLWWYVGIGVILWFF